MVEPEVDEHFLQLVLRSGRSNQFLRGELDDHLPLWTDILGACGAFHAGLRSADRHLTGTRRLHRRLRRASTFLRAQVDFGQGAWRQCQRRQRGEPRLESRVRHPLRMQLRLQPGVESNGLQALDGGRRGAEGDAIRDMDSGVPLQPHYTGARDADCRADQKDETPGE